MPNHESNLPELVKSKGEESAVYFRQWLVWLGVGSAGGAISLCSLAAHLPDPNHGFKFVMPSLWMFLFGVILAGASVLVLSRKLAAIAEHYAYAHNRAELKRLIDATPEVFSSPQAVADRQNVERNRSIEQHDNYHSLAEKYWNIQKRWSLLLIVCCTSSALLFVAGLAVPLMRITLGHSLKP